MKRSRALAIALLVLIPAVVLIAIALSQDGDTIGDRPCVGLSDDECTDKLHAAANDYFRRVAEWQTNVLPTLSLDYAKLPRLEDQGRIIPEFTDFESASKAAELIVHLRVTDVRMEPGALAMTTAAVVDYWKGSGDTTAVFGQNAHIVPTEKWEPAISEHGLSPFLAPGDEAVLFLRRRSADPSRSIKLDSDGVYRVILETGWYKIEDGKIRVVGGEDEPVVSQKRFDGIGVDALRELVAEALSAPE